MTQYFVFENLPRVYSGQRVPRHTHSLYLGYPRWTVSIYELIGETEQRYLVRWVSGDEQNFPRDGQLRRYVEKTQQRTVWRTTDLNEAKAYREHVMAAWATECAARDRITAPWFAEIERLGHLILEADADRLEAAARLRAEARDWCPPATVVEAAEPVA